MADQFLEAQKNNDLTKANKKRLEDSGKTKVDRKRPGQKPLPKRRMLAGAATKERLKLGFVQLKLATRFQL